MKWEGSKISYVFIKDGLEITCDLKGNQYHYSIKKEDDSILPLGLNPKEPMELTPKTAIGVDIWNYLKEKPYSALNDEERNNLRREDFSRITNELQNYVKSIKDLEKEKESDYEKYLDEKYLKLYAHFEVRAKDNRYSPLQFLSQISQGLGVGLTVEVIKAFFGFYQTYLGLKGTNVIAIGSQSSGKSHIIEIALEMIPPEKVHKGVKSVAHFFRTFNGQDLTGHIFYLGDLGGDNDDEDTIKLRDKIKQLTTEGYIERGIVDDGLPSDEYVTGYPCLCYTTANESMINAQEKSRSMIITPPDVDPERLETFNFLMDNPGEFKSLIDKITKDKESVKGLVQESKKTIGNIECFNPYMYNITEFLKNIDDYNRKIKEFNAILKLVCLLNEPKTFTHDYYTDEDNDYETVTTTMIIARKQDVLNAVHLFDHNNDLLPTEVALANGLLDSFKVYDFEEQTDFKDINDFENKVKDNLIYLKNGDLDWDTLTDIKDKPNKYFFSGDYLRKKFSNKKWYRRNREDIFNKLHKLHKANILILIGKSEGYNVYGLANDLEDKITSINPEFGGEKFDKAKKLFSRSHPSLYDEVNEYITNDVKLNLKSIDFEIEGSFLYNVPW